MDHDRDDDRLALIKADRMVELVPRPSTLEELALFRKTPKGKFGRCVFGPSLRVSFPKKSPSVSGPVSPAVYISPVRTHVDVE